MTSRHRDEPSWWQRDFDTASTATAIAVAALLVIAAVAFAFLPEPNADVPPGWKNAYPHFIEVGTPALQPTFLP